MTEAPVSPAPIISAAVVPAANIPAANVAPSPRSVINFSNPLVLRTAVLVASVTTVLIPFIYALAPVLGGFFTVALYRWRSKALLTVGDGAKLAWLTALINSILLTIFLTAGVSYTGTNFDSMREQMRHQAFGPEQLQFVNSPWFPAFLVLFGWVFLFVISSLLHVAGGALGAFITRQKTSYR